MGDLTRAAPHTHPVAGGVCQTMEALLFMVTGAPVSNRAEVE
jgi:hypothetical protein